MSEEIMKKLEEHDQQFRDVANRLDSHDKKFRSIDERFDAVDKRFDGMDKRFDGMDKRFDGMDKRQEKMAEKLLEHDGRLDRIEQNMATKDDLRVITNTLDEIVYIVKNVDQELKMVTNGMRRHEDMLEKHETDIEKIKPLVGLA